MIEYDRSLIRAKTNEIYPIMNEAFKDCSNDQEKIEWTRTEIIKRFEKKDATSVLAIIDCFITITGKSGIILGLQEGDNSNYKSIEETIADDRDYGDVFCLVIGEARAFHFFD
ncbi:MAG: hypothetical protein RCO49_01235 [Rickettsia endosymbiont of Argas persicus]